MKQIASLFIVLIVSFVSMYAVQVANIENTSTYIPAPHSVESFEELLTVYLEPVFFENENGPTIGVTTLGVLRVDGLYFRDSNNNGLLDTFEDWRLPVSVRAVDAVSRLTLEQKTSVIHNIILLDSFANSIDAVYDEDGNVMLSQLIPSIDGNWARTRTIGTQGITDFYPGMIYDLGLRGSVVRVERPANVMAYHNNALQQLSEFSSVSRNEVAIPFFINMNPVHNTNNLSLSADARPTFVTLPREMGLAAAVMGEVARGGDYSLIGNLSEISRRGWNAVGIRAMYGPQLDVVTDPRWVRNLESFSEDPEVVANIAREMVIAYQLGTEGVQPGGVVIMPKHFPGEGAADLGFRSNFASGQWRLYPTAGSLERYQLPPFQAAFDAGASSVMPGYSRPTSDGRSVPQIVSGVKIEVEEISSAYNYAVLTTLARDVMGFNGFVNMDSRSVSSVVHGVYDLSLPERLAAIINAGTDVFGDNFSVKLLDAKIEAVETGLLPIENLNRAVTNRLTVMLQMGLFENPYVCPATALKISAETTTDPAIFDAHLRSFVLMKNINNALPIVDTNAKLYVGHFTSSGSNENSIESMRKQFAARGFTIVEDYNEADYAYLMVIPGLQSTRHMGVIDLVDGLEIEERYLNSQQLTGYMTEATTVRDIGRIRTVSYAVRGNGGQVIASISITSPWILTNLEPYVDALIGMFGGWFDAQLDIITGKFNPTGVLPLTMVGSNEVIAVNWVEIDGEMFEVSVSPDDVPGIFKDQYIAPYILANAPGGRFAYIDSEGNVYEAWFGLSFPE